MSVELVLSVVGFALSAGGIVPVLYGREGRNRVIIALIFAALVPTTGVVIYREYAREQTTRSIMDEIERKLDNNIWTYEQIHEAVHYQPPQITREALFRLVGTGRIGDKQEIFSRDGIEWKVRAYYVR